MLCCLRLVANQQLFVELFSRPKAGDLNFNISVGMLFIFYRQPAQGNHAHSQIVDFDGIAHVKKKHVAPAAERGCLKHELTSLWNRHKVAGNVWVRKRHRAA